MAAGRGGALSGAQMAGKGEEHAKASMEAIEAILDTAQEASPARVALITGITGQVRRAAARRHCSAAHIIWRAILRLCIFGAPWCRIARAAIRPGPRDSP